jgi:hypothetical protein
MTDRVQPGAIDSIIRNDELTQIFNQFSEGWIQPSSDPPTPAAVRRGEIDETALDAFSLVGTSGFDITIAPGEGFVGGWCARDITTTVTVPSNTTSTVVLAWSLDAVFDPVTDQNRDLADKVRVDLAQNVDPQYPSTELFNITADGNAITTTTDRRRIGPTVVADSLEATATITDPEGNTVTSLSDPVRVTDEASTFTENGITVTNNGTEINNGSVELAEKFTGIWVDDFEDGVDSGWSGDLSNISAITSTVLSGSQSGEITSSNETTQLASQSLGNTTQNYGFSIKINNDPGTQFDRVDIKIKDSANTQLGTLSFDDASNDLIFNNSKVRNWSVNVVYEVFLDWDFGNSEVQIFVNGVDEGTFPLGSSTPTDWDFIEFENITGNSGGNRTVIVDDISERRSGDVLVEFQSGAPDDIDSYDLATFQKTNAGGVVIVDVEDGNGTALFTDITKDFDISTVDTTKNVKLRANLSRSNTSNNPTVDFLARRFTR